MGQVSLNTFATTWTLRGFLSIYLFLTLAILQFSILNAGPIHINKTHAEAHLAAS